MVKDFQSLLYIGDVTVEPTHAGSLLLWRLLEAWPEEKIRLLEFVSSERKTDQKLPNTSTHLLPFARFSRSRFNRLHSEILTRSDFLNRNVFERALHESNSNAILSVAHGWSWIWAANFALRENIPYHLIVHDDFPSFHPRLGRETLKNNCRLFRQIVFEAASVFCVSETMKVAYEREFDGEFDVLLPSRGRGQKCELRSSSGDSLRRVPQVVYAGSINCESIARSLREFAEEMESRDLGMLIIYSEIKDSQILEHPRISLRPMVPPDQTFDLLRKEADFLLLLMNFDGEAARNMQMCFPSKLVDYTAAAKPILFWGPKDGSGIAWGASEVGPLSVSSSRNPAEIIGIMKNLYEDPQSYRIIAKRGFEAGMKDFEFSSCFMKFSRKVNQRGRTIC